MSAPVSERGERGARASLCSAVLESGPCCCSRAGRRERAAAGLLTWLLGVAGAVDGASESWSRSVGCSTAASCVAIARCAFGNRNEYTR